MEGQEAAPGDNPSFFSGEKSHAPHRDLERKQYYERELSLFGFSRNNDLCQVLTVKMNCILINDLYSVKK